jgi:Tfp pilus assembly protein PilZ
MKTTIEESTHHIHLHNQDELKNIFLPFLKNSGIMLSSTNPLIMGQQLSVSIEFWDESEPCTTLAKVVWIAPHTINTPKFKGYGIEFVGNNALNIRMRIEKYLSCVV